MMYTTNTTNVTQQIQHCEQLIGQLMQQTQQASRLYQQMLQQEQQNAAMLEQLADRERQAVHNLQTALQGHHSAMQSMQHVVQLCQQLEHTVQSMPAANYAYGASAGQQSYGMQHNGFQ